MQVRCSGVATMILLAVEPSLFAFSRKRPGHLHRSTSVVCHGLQVELMLFCLSCRLVLVSVLSLPPGQTTKPTELMPPHKTQQGCLPFLRLLKERKARTALFLIASDHVQRYLQYMTSVFQTSLLSFTSYSLLCF